jgi:acetyltransferase EpsM
LPVLGAADRTHEFLAHDDVYFVTALLKVKEAYPRSRKIEALGIPVNRFYTVIHPSATVSRRAVIGPGTFVGPHVNVMPNVVMGRHCSLRASANIGHDCKIGNFCYVGPNSTLSGRVTLGAGVHLGPNTSVLERVKLGDFSVIGIGSVVLKHVPEFSIAYGNPAAVRASLDKYELESREPS